jgi:HTH-type transcriptional regulator, sugar sensing transcriptional regulator
MNLIESLKNLGLNEKEAKVYLALLQLGKTTAYSVAVRSGLKKPTTYVILKQLIEKGFAYNVPRAKKQQFMAISPDECVAIAKEKIKLSEQDLPELLALKKKRELRANVAYFEGVRGAEEMYKNLFKTMKRKVRNRRGLVGFYAKGSGISKDLESAFSNINEECHRLGIKRRAITAYHPYIIKNYLREDVMKRYNIVQKALSEEKYSSDISIETYDNYVQILSQKHLQAILIEDSDIAGAIRQIFEMVWELVEKDRENYLKFSSLDARV